MVNLTMYFRGVPSIVGTQHKLGWGSTSFMALYWEWCKIELSLFSSLIGSQCPYMGTQLIIQVPSRAPVSAAMRDVLHWLSFPQRDI